MRKILGLYVKFMNSRGASATEYALLISLIALVIIAAIGALGSTIEGVFNAATAELAPYSL